MRGTSLSLSQAATIRCGELWLRLADIFPTVMLDIEQGRAEDIIQYDTYRYKSPIFGSGYMVWTFSSSLMFWEKAILPILSEYKAERVTWSNQRHNPRVFLVKLPSTVEGVRRFRIWAKSDSVDTSALCDECIDMDRASWHDDVIDCDYDDYDYYFDYDQEDIALEQLSLEVAIKFDKKARRKSR